MIDSIVTAIVRPPRSRYSIQDLGANNIRHKGVEYHREDFIIKNNRDLNLNGSIWGLLHPLKGDSESCIVYLHPNSGSRVDVIKTRIMTIAANSKCAVCGFDFSGCGESQGDNISLGVNEKDDLCTILSYLYEKGYKKYILWGRSMGAATAVIFYGAYRELVKGTVLGLVLDSPFTSMQGLALEYSTTRVGVPTLLLSPAVHYLRHIIQTNYNFDLYHMTPIGAAPRIDIPTIVLSGSEDKIVPPKLSEELYEAFAGPKMRIFFQGGHNTHRPSAIYEAIRVFVVGILRGLPIVDVLNMSTEVLKNQLIEFPQFQIPSQVEANNSPSDSNNNNNNNTQEKNSQQKNLDVDRRRSMDLPVDEAIQITAETARALEPLRMMGDINIESEPESLTPTQSIVFTSVAEEVEKKMLSNENSEGSWSSIPVSTTSDKHNGSNGSNGSNNGNEYHHTLHNHRIQQSHLKHEHDHENGNLSNHEHPNQLVQQQHNRTKQIKQQQQQKLPQSKPCVYSISIDYGSEGNDENDEDIDESIKTKEIEKKSSETSSWIGTVGMLLGYSSTSQNQQPNPLIVQSGQYEGSRIGSYGYLMNQIGNTMCPPDKLAWEKLLITRCEELILDIVCDQILSLSSGLLDYTKSDQPNEIINSSLIPPDIPPDERCLLMSMIVAELSSSIGLLSSVGGEETLNWGKLILSSDTELVSIISTKESQRNAEKTQIKLIQEEKTNDNNNNLDNNNNNNNLKNDIQENNKISANKNENNISNNNGNSGKNKSKNNKKDEQEKEVRVISIVV